MLQKPPGDCVFKLDNFVETRGAQGLILLAGGVARELAASMWWRQGSLEHLHSLQAEPSLGAQKEARWPVLPTQAALSFVLVNKAAVVPRGTDGRRRKRSHLNVCFSWFDYTFFFSAK